jgi:hypothetical protein
VGLLMPNGEVEGPGTHVGQGPRAHNLSRAPRRQSDHASRTPPTIVRRSLVEGLMVATKMGDHVRLK